MIAIRKKGRDFALRFGVAFVLLFVFLWAVAHGQTSAEGDQCISNALAGGTSDAITIPLLPCSTNTNLLILTASAANTTATPTLQQIPGGVALSIVKSGGAQLAAGDIAGAGYIALLTSTGTNWVLLNPATSQGSPGATVQNEAGLVAFPHATSQVVTRLGYVTAGDGGGQQYIWVNANCTLGSGAGDGGAQVPASGGGCWIANFQGQANAQAWGADPTQSGSSQTALQNFASYVCGGSGLGGYIPPGNYLYTGITLALPTGVKCKIRGAGPLQTTLFQTNATATDWNVSGTGSQQFILADLALKEVTVGLKTSGYAIVLTALYYPEVNDVTIQGWNGVNDVSSATAKINVNFGYLNGTEGMHFVGTGGANLFGAIVSATGSANGNTNLVWLDMDSYAYSITVQYAALAYGGKCEQMRDSAAAGTSAPQWLFNVHLECDHNNAKAIDLVAGSGYTLAPGSWVGSSLAGDCVVTEATWGTGVGSGAGLGQTKILGSRISGCFGRGVALLGGADLTVNDNTITANGQGTGGTHYDEVYIASGVVDWQIKGNWISNTGDGLSSTDVWCVNVVTGGSFVDLELSGNKDMSCSTGALSNLPVGNGVIVNSNDGVNKGTWTPIVRGLTTAGTWTYTSQLGWYTIHDGLVTVDAYIATSGSSGSPTGQAGVSGLPFASANTTNRYAGCGVGFYGGLTFGGGYTQLGAAVQPNSTAVGLYEGGSTESLTTLPIAGVGGTINLGFSCTYPLE